MLPATFDLSPGDAVGVLAPLRGQVVAHEGPTVVLDLPEDTWGADVNLMVAALVAGEVMEAGAPAVAATGGGLGPDGAGAQVDAGGGPGLLLLLGTKAHAFPGGLEAAVRRAVGTL